MSNDEAFPEVQPALRKIYERGFRASSDAITITRLDDGVILEANESFCSMVGFARDQVIGQTAGQLGIYADGTARARMLRRVLHRGGIRDHEVTVRTKQGATVHASLTADLVSANGEVHLFAIGRDMTDRRLREDETLQQLQQLHQTNEPSAVHGSDNVEEDGGLIDLTSGPDDHPASSR